MERPPEDEAVTRILRGDEPGSIAAAVAALRSGGVIAIPTDTVYGLAAAVDIPAAIERLYTLKQRPEAKAIPVLLSGMAEVSRVCAEFPKLAVILATRFWPGPLTIIVPGRGHLSPLLTDELGDGRRSVAVRVPDHAVARAIIAAAGGALAVTSANVSGESEALEAREAVKIGTASPVVVVDGGRAPAGRPSTIVVASGSAPIPIREGAIPFAEIISAASNPSGI